MSTRHVSYFARWFSNMPLAAMQGLAFTWHAVDTFDRLIVHKSAPSKANKFRLAVAVIGIAWAGGWLTKNLLELQRTKYSQCDDAIANGSK